MSTLTRETCPPLHTAIPVLVDGDPTESMVVATVASKLAKDVVASGSTEHRSQLKDLIPRKQLYQGAGTKNVQRDMDAHHDKSCFRILFVRSAGDLGDVILIQEKDQGFEVTARGS
jgi:hypothetical protein